MDKKLDTLYTLCEIVSRKLEECAQGMDNNGNMTTTEIDVLDKLTHTLKSIKATIAMMEAEEEEGGMSERSYARRSNRRSRNGGSYEGGSYDGGSYEGGGMSGRRRRDSMGRFSRRYSGADGMDELLDEMRGMMMEMPDEKRREAQKFIQKMESM